jgi:hypothetical protein
VSPANIADKSAQMSHRIAYHREKNRLRHPGSALGVRHGTYRAYRTDGTYEETLDIAWGSLTNHQSPITNHQSPLTSHQSPLTNHLSPFPAFPAFPPFRRCTSRFSMQLSPP